MEEVYFLAHSLVDFVPVFDMMDELCYPCHCKGDVPRLISVGSKVGTVL